MKRALLLILIIAAVIVGFLSIRGTMPFLPVFGTSMEPEFKAGNLITINPVEPSEVKVGDIIVFSVPAAVREYYNYPPLVAHRVININPETMTFRTKGDNTGEDPFTVRAQDLKGTVGQQIPYLGFPLLFMQSDYGLIFTIIALSLLALYLYGSELSRGRQTVQRGIFAPVIEETQRSSRILERRLETTEKGMAGTQQALNSFASAIAEYAEHLASHTAAVKDLASASQELKKGAVEQNQVLSHLVETLMERSPAKTEPPISKPREAIPEEHVAPKREEVVLRVERISYPPGCYREKQPAPTPEYKPQPTGCYKNQKERGTR